MSSSASNYCRNVGREDNFLISFGSGWTAADVVTRAHGGGWEVAWEVGRANDKVAASGECSH